MAVTQDTTGNGLGDDELIQMAKTAQNGTAFTPRFDRTYDSPALQREYETRRRAELALMANLAFWTNHDERQMWRLFQESELYRPKLEEVETYKKDLLETASELVGDEGYTGADGGDD